jgi:DNA polymerase III epsilon subunit-like protein
MQLPFKLVCIDLETTGLDMKRASIVQLSAVIVNKQFEPIRGLEFNSYVKPLDSYKEPNAMKIHEIPENIFNNAPTLEEVLIMFENFCLNEKILASWGTYFDIPFLKEQYEKIGRKYPFSHRTIDLKSIATWERAIDGIEIKGGLKHYLKSLDHDFKGVQHDALCDIRNTVELLKIIKGQHNI